MTKWFVAPSYQTAEIIGDAINDINGKKVIRIRYTCPRCSGTGTYGPYSVFNGTCFECHGNGKISKYVRAYNEKEYDAYTRNLERARERKEKEKEQIYLNNIKNSEENKIEWLLKHGFNSEGVTYMVSGNTYEIKDILKARGFYFDKILNWHIADASLIPIDREAIKVEFDKILNWNCQTKQAYYKEDAAAAIENILYPPEENAGGYVGEIGEKLKDIAAIVEDKHGFESQFGYSFVITFKDDNNNLYVWYSKSSAAETISIGKKIILSGTVKDHKTYKNKMQTILTRCKMTE